MMTKILPIFAVALLIFIVACAASMPAPEECAPVCPTEPLTIPEAEPAASSPSDTVPRITIDEVRQKMEAEADILLVDARHKEEYDVDHIKGAISIPLDTIVAGGWTLPLDKEIILY